MDTKVPRVVPPAAQRRSWGVARGTQEWRAINAEATVRKFEYPNGNNCSTSIFNIYMLVSLTTVDPSCVDSIRLKSWRS